MIFLLLADEMNLTGWIPFYFNSHVLEVTESLLYSIQRRGMMKFYRSWSEEKHIQTRHVVNLVTDKVHVLGW